MKKRVVRILLVALLLASSAVAAMSEQKNNFVSAKDAQTFELEFKQVQAGMAKGGRFQSIGEKELARLNDLLGTIQGVFARSPDAGTLSAEDKALLVSSSDEINGILNRADGDHKICRMEYPIGSNIPKKTCTTSAQREQDLKNAATILHQSSEGH
jgi:PBP1b-binding outer membrane lipoprotein LpoB